MANVPSNVLVGVTGSANVAPIGTALATDPTTTLNVAFKEAGYVSEDGVTQTIDESTTEIKAWQNADVVRRIQTDHSVQYAFTMIETNAVVLAAYYGNYSAGKVEIRSGAMTRQSWALQVVDGTNKIRIVIPDGQVVERGEITYQNGEEIGYPITIECYPDATGVKAYKYLATSAVSA